MVFGLELIREHFINPRNVGDVPNASAVGKAGAPICGGVLRISLELDEYQRVSEARFKVAGCSFLIGLASLFTERLKGLTSGEAAAMAQATANSIAERETMPAERSCCSHLPSQALLAAIRSYSDSVRREWNGDEALICTCFCVSEKRIEREIKFGGLHTIDEVTKVCRAGAGCGSCLPLIEQIIDDYYRNGLWSLTHDLSR